MWLVLAHPWDAAARALVDRRADHLVRVTPADVRGHGWSLSVGAGGSTVTWAPATAAVGGGRTGGIPGAALDGVLTRIDGVGAADLPHIHTRDRHYAAAELGAFLLAWLDACPAPVVNRPSPGCLSGPLWSPGRWRLAAREAGLALAGAAHPAGPGRGRQDGGQQDSGRPGGARVVTVVGDHVLGTADPQLADGVRRLAAVAGTYLLGVTFDGVDPDGVDPDGGGTGGVARFVSATPCPELDAHAESALAASLGWPPC